MSPGEIAGQALPEDPIEALEALSERRARLSELLFQAAEKEYPGIEAALSAVLNASEKIRASIMVGTS